MDLSMNSNIKEKILIISCQAEGSDPFNSPKGVSLFAKAAELGGASAIRSEGIAKTKMILKTVNIPVIGLVKSKFPDQSVCITRSLRSVEALVRIGCKIIAIDGTFRKKGNFTGPEFINFVVNKFDCKVMADISSVEEALECHDAGAHYIGTTLSGYVPGQKPSSHDEPDYELVSKLVSLKLSPIIAEGRIQNGEQAKKLIDLGVWAVVIGTAITRPRLVVQKIVNQINLENGN